MQLDIFRFREIKCEDRPNSEHIRPLGTEAILTSYLLRVSDDLSMASDVSYQSIGRPDRSSKTPSKKEEGSISLLFCNGVPSIFT